MLALLWTLPAYATAVNGGIQITAFPGALDFAGEVMTGQTLYIEEPEVSGADIGCYDTVGIRDFNASVPLDIVDLEFRDDTIIVDVHFGAIRGENMTVYGTDDDLWDVCPSLEAQVNSVEVTQGRLLAEFSATASDADFDLNIVGTPTFTGDLTTDIDWVPDSLVLGFVEDSFFESVEALIAEEVPPLVKGLLGNSLYAGQIGDIDLDVQLTEVAVERALMLGMDVDAAWLGEGCPISGVIREPTGANPAVRFDPSTDSDIGIAVTEYQINRLFFGAWEDGLLCFEAGPLYTAVEMVEATLGEGIPNSDVEISFNQSPQFVIREDGMTMAIDGLHLGIYGDVDGERRALIGLDAGITLEAEIRVDHGLSSFVFDLSNVDLDLEALVADPLITDRNGITDRLVEFLEGWAMDTLANRIADVPIYGNLFEVSGLFLRVDEMTTEYGAIRVAGSLYESSDPDVDVAAPDTDAYISRTSADSVYVKWSATDDSDGPIAFSWRLNSGAWSYWTSESTGAVPTPEPGTHIIEVRARDAWLNTDPSPKAIVFRVDEAETSKGCGCATQPIPNAAFLWSIAAVIVGVRRRRE